MFFYSRQSHLNMFQSAEPTPILSAVIALVFLSKSCVWKRAGAVIIKYNRQFYDIWQCTHLCTSLPKCWRFKHSNIIIIYCILTIIDRLWD